MTSARGDDQPGSIEKGRALKDHYTLRERKALEPYLGKKMSDVGTSLQITISEDVPMAVGDSQIRFLNGKTTVSKGWEGEEMGKISCVLSFKKAVASISILRSTRPVIQFDSVDKVIDQARNSNPQEKIDGFGCSHPGYGSDITLADIIDALGGAAKISIRIVDAKLRPSSAESAHGG